MKGNNKKTETPDKPVNKIHHSSLPPELASAWRSSLANNSLVHIAIVVLLILIIYGNTLHAPFQWDEATHIVNNPIIKDLRYFVHPAEAHWAEQYDFFLHRYVAFLTFALNYRMHGLSVPGYHIVNIAIHIANSILVYFLVLLTFRTPFGSREAQKSGSSEALPTLQPYRPLNFKCIAFFSAVIFAVHPLQTEAVTYIMQRFASLAAFFYLLSLASYVKFRLSESVSAEPATDTKERGKRQSYFYYGISLLSAILAMKTKENAFTLPFVIMLYEYCFFSRPYPDFKSQFSKFKFTFPFFLILTIVLLGLMTLPGGHDLDPRANGQRFFSRWDYLFSQFRVIVTYLRLLFLPVNQNVDYDYSVYNSFFIPQVFLSFILLASLFGLGVYLIRKVKGEEVNSELKNVKNINIMPFSRFVIHDSRPFRLMGFGILWFFITLSVESSIIPLWMLICEYRMYLPSVGIIICVVTGVFLMIERIKDASDSSPAVSKALPAFFMAISVLAIGGLSGATHLRNEVWGDRIRLWEDTVKKSPGIEIAHTMLGNAYQERNMLDKAEEEFLTASRLRPNYDMAHNNLGLVYEKLNRPDKAIEQYLTAVKLKPDDATAHSNLGNIYRSLNMLDKAEDELQTAVKLRPDLAEAHCNLGIVYKSLNMLDKAREHYLIALRIRPDLAEAHNNLGNIFRALNMTDKAIEEFQTAVKLKPGLTAVHYNLGLAYYDSGQMGNAQRELARVLEIEPTNQQAQQLLKIITTVLKAKK